MIRSRHWRYMGQCLGLAAVYFVAAKLGLRLAFVHASATAVWPPTGIALAVFLVLGSRVWPAIFAGAFLANITTAGSVATSLGIATGNTLEGLLGAALVSRFAEGLRAFERPRNILKFAFLAAGGATTVSATIGPTPGAVCSRSRSRWNGSPWVRSAPSSVVTWSWAHRHTA